MVTGGINMNKKTEYPVNYETFKESILKKFVDGDWKYNTNFTREQKQEFIDEHNFDFTESYKEECENYDQGNKNVFTTPEDTSKYIYGLLFDCEHYFNSKNTSRQSSKSMNDGKYPMDYDDFEEKLGELFPLVAQQLYTDINNDMAVDDWNKFIKEESSQTFTYNELCEEYDKGNKVAFSEERMRKIASEIADWIYF